MPACYQPHLTRYGQHGRHYDDNIWVALNYCNYYQLAHKPASLERAVTLYQYVYSGWSDEIGGGIFRREQQREAKHTYSNAPSIVLDVKLYRLTKDTKHLEKAKEMYAQTKKHLCDPTDHFYQGDTDLKGKVSKEKYVYNSGQVIQAGVLLYEEMGDEQYLHDTQRIAAGIDAFLRTEADKKDPTIKVYRDMAWPSVILFRRLEALYKTDKNPVYVDTMAENTLRAWENYWDESGLLGKD